MNYPLISEYIEAIKAAEDNFEELKHLRSVLDDDGQPVMTSGNFAVVFKMKDVETDKLHAVKCFLREQEGRGEAYHQIAEELKDVDSPYLISIRYLDKELFVDTSQTIETEFPVLLMDWVEGKTLDKYLRENLDDKYALEMLAYRFSQLAQWLIPQPFAHGDLKPDNILVREDGTLVLVDYDGMYVPAMKGQKARELGSPDFRHPLRTEDDFNEQIDDFPLISILFSLKAISINYHWLEEYGSPDRLLMSATDYRELKECLFLKEQVPFDNTTLNRIVALFLFSFTKSINTSLFLQLISVIENEEYPIITNEEEIANAWKDEKGVRYSQDRKRLLKSPIIDWINGDYYIQPGTKVICNSALCGCWGFEKAFFPNGLIKIGDNAFYTCRSLKTIEIPNSVSDIGKWAFYHCCLESLSIPNSVRTIGEWAFAGCEELKQLKLSNGISKLETGVFSGCYELEEVVVPKSVKSIGKNAFSHCKNLKTIYLTEGVREIGDNPFIGCENLESIIVPIGSLWRFEHILPNDKGKLVEKDFALSAEELYEKGKSYWRYKDYVKHNYNEAIMLYDIAAQLGHKKAQEELMTWGVYWFDKNTALYSKDRKTIYGLWSLYTNEYEILQGTKSIADNAFCDLGGEIDYSYLDKIVIPSSVKTIGHSPFNKYLSEIICYSPYFEVDNNTIYTKGKKRLIQCLAKTEEFVVPDEVKFIDDHAFYGCKSKKIIIPESVKKMGINPFIEMDTDGNTLKIISYSSKFVIDNDALYEDNTKLISYWGKGDSFSVPNGIKEIGEYAFFASNLKIINLPDTIESIGDCAFGWCFSLEKVLTPSSSAEKFKRIMDGYQGMIRIEK